jgi:hypothetical protein
MQWVGRMISGETSGGGSACPSRFSRGFAVIMQRALLSLPHRIALISACPEQIAVCGG